MALTYDQAIQELLKLNNPTANDLRTLVSQVSVEASGAVTLLYSGDIATDVRSSSIISSMIANGENIRVIDNTDAARFLQSRDFLSATARVYDIDMDNLLDKAYRGPAIDWLYAAEEGPWSDTSTRFVNATIGEIRTLTPFADPTRVFALTEIPAALNNPAITQINGYATADIRRMTQELLDSGKAPEFADRVVLDMLNRASANDVSLLNVALDADGNLTGLGTRQYFSNAGLSDLGSDLPAGVTSKPASTLMGSAQSAAQQQDSLRNALWANDYMQEYASERHAALTATGDLEGLARSAKYLNKLGIAGSILGASLVASEANAAYQSGNTAEAQRILEKYAAESAGSWAAGAAAGALAAPLLAFGPVGWAAWGILTIGAGVIGGYAGENVFAKLIDASQPTVVTNPLGGSVRMPGGEGFFDGVPTKVSYSNGVIYEQWRDPQGRGIDTWEIPLNNGGWRWVTSNLNPSPGGIIGDTREFDANGIEALHETRRLLPSGTGIQTQAYNAGNNLIVTRVQQIVNGKSVDVTFSHDSNGAATVVMINSINGQPVADSAEAINTLNASGLTPEQLVSGDLPEQAETVFTVYDPTHPSGLQTLVYGIATYGGTVIDALSLIKAIQSGEPLPLVVSGLRLANNLSNLNGTPNLALSGASNVASGILSLLSLDAALERGDTLGAVTAGTQAVAFGAQAFADFATSQAFASISEGTIDLATETLALQSQALANTVGNALPFLNLANSIAQGDTAGIAVSALGVMNSVGMFAAGGAFASAALAAAVPVIGWAYAVYSIIDSLFSDTPDVPDPWGTGQYIWNGTGIGFQSAGETGGNEAVSNVMSSVLSTMNALIAQEQGQNPGSALGIIPNRMPTVGYDMSGYRYTDIDPLSGAEKHPALRFDTNGRPYNATPGSAESYAGIGEAIIRSAIARGAIAPEWEVQTAKLQTDAGDPQAGLTEEERAARAGHLAAPPAGPTQTFRPVALDLDGDGIETVGKAGSGVAFDVDDSGFMKRTGWIKGDDAFLVLDRNYNGQIDTGREMFSNGTVDISRKGLAGMAWVDANYDGRITAFDPVWNELQIWKDIDGDGTQDAGEVSGLAALGITELNYSMGRFVQNGVVKELGSPDLEADTEGTRITVVPEGIIVQTSGGKISLLVTRIDDLTQVEANRDGATGYEDIEMIIGGADLLANDTLGGFPGRDMTITGLTNLRHGTGFLDVNGFVHFQPEANYSGSAAGFDYIARAINGQVGTAGVDLTLQNINDAPTVDHVNHSTRPIYGYTPVTSTEWGYTSGGQAIYEPYAIDNYYGSYYGSSVIPNPQAGIWYYEYHTTPVGYEDTGGGSVAGADVDDAASSLTYQIVGEPQYGSVGLNGDGTFQYTGWQAPNTPSAQHSEGDEERQDSFQVRITDPHGASVTQSVYVTHYGPYTPPTPPGGGGGKKPIAIDLDGNGFEFVNVDDSNVFFDVNGDGWKERIAWTAPGDGVLGYDINGDGKIDSIDEISFTRYKEGAQSDLQGLSAFDTNRDGVFSAADDAWSKFGVWRDVNRNGVTDAGEFRTLEQMGVASIALTSDGEFRVVNGQTVHGVGAVTLNNGNTLAMADVTLAYSNQVQVKLPDGTTHIVDRPPFSPSGEVLEGTPEKDLILGKNGNNIIHAYAGDDVVFEDGGNDIIDGGAGNDLIYSGADNDLVFGGTGDDTIFAGLGSDLVFGGDGQDAIFAEGGNDIVFGGAGNDLISGGWGNDVLSGDDGNDQIYGESGNDALFGRNGDDELAGMDGYDRLDGGTGDDLLDGGADADEMVGGTGNDTYVVDNVADIVTELAGEGVDTVRASIDYALADTLENLTLTGTDNLSGSGNAQDNRLVGNAGANTLRGEAGNDWIDGGAGADRMLGGAGDDTFIADNVGDTVAEQADEGHDTVRASVSYGLSGNVEDLVLTGWQAINGSGNALDNVLTGNLSDNVLDGGAGADSMTGGRGDDTYVVDNAGDAVTELGGEGVDTVESGISYQLGDNLENLALTGNENLTGSGNALDNVILGNSGANRIDGGIGRDAMAGGAGDDTYAVDDAGDLVTEAVAAGNDTVESSIGYTLTPNVENLILTGAADIDGTGNELDNVVLGNSGANRIDGGLGMDAMTGGAGDDTYIVDNTGDTVVERESEGTDIIYSSVSYVLPENVENLTLTGSADIDGSGNVLDNILIGNAGNNVLSGREGADRLWGMAGNDRLDGGLGADVMAGGAGDDIYVVDETGDAVTELRDEGVDTVESGISYLLGDNLENLTLTGSADIDGSGNGLDNIILGNSGANHIDGGLGMDAMTGGAGDDTYIVDNTGDTVAELAGEGTDIIYAGVSYVLPENVENLTLTGSADIDGTGNVLDNILIGNVGNNVLSGREGNDRMLGMAGNDRLDGGQGADGMAGGGGDDAYIVDNAGDTVLELAGEGTDIIYSSVSYVLPDNVENLTLTGTDHIDGTGNGLDNILIGNDGNNVLTGLAGNDRLFGLKGDDRLDGGLGIDQIYGGAGNDVLTGGDGDDVIQGGEGNDTFVYNLGDDLDTVSDTSGIDSIQFGSGISFDTVAIRTTELDGVKTAHLRLLNAGGCEMPDQGMDFVLDANGASPIESFRFADGSSFAMEDLLIRTKYFYGTSKTPVIRTGRHDDIIYAGPAANTVYAGTGNDIVYGQQRNDTLYGEGGDDYLVGGEGNDTLDGGCGTDILSGGNGDDVLRDAGGGNAALLGGNGRDTIAGGAGNDFIVGGKQDDILDGRAGYNVFSFSGETGRDVILPFAGARNTLSLGDVDYDDLAFRKSGDDLTLEADNDSRITFKGWYADVVNRNFVTLQVIGERDDREGHGHDHDALPFNALVETFDFQALVDRFDQARAANVKQGGWDLMNGLLDAHLASSDGMVLGGDLAFYDAQEGGLKDMALLSAQGALKDKNFGMLAQASSPYSAASDGAIRLG